MRMVLALAMAMVVVGCGGGPAPPNLRTGGLHGGRGVEGRPPVAAVVRAGDARGALAMAVSTEGIAPERGAVPGVALAALVEARLSGASLSRGALGLTTVGGWGSWRLRVLVQGGADAASLVDALRTAMLTPVGVDDPALGVVQRKVEALARRPLPDRALADVAQCTGEAFGLGSDAPPSAAELEAWRKAAHGIARVAFATAGDEALAAAVQGALASGPAWPAASPVTTSRASQSNASAVTYDASSEIPAGAARVIVVARTATPERAVEPATSLGDPRGPLSSRLAALDAPARVRAVVATAHGDGGCVAVTLDLAARDLERDAAARIATAAALARQEVTVELSDFTAGEDMAGALAERAGDPRDAAERAAWWSLSGRSPDRGDNVDADLAVGLAAPRDTGTRATVPAAEIRTEIDRATMAWHAPVVEAHVRVERGQGETWILLASPCGTSAEATDAGSGAAAATAAALQAQATAGDAEVEPFAAPDGLGVLVHGPARPGESAQAHARRLADVAARAFAADALEDSRISQARTALLARTADVDDRLLATTGSALAPGHPSWIIALGTRSGLASMADADVETRAATLRAGPLRVAVMASEDRGQADAAVRAVDRWVARRPGEVRTCPSPPVVRSRPGTYAVDLPAGATSEVLLTVPVPADASARTAAIFLAAMFDGGDGLLARALGAPSDQGRALATAWSAALIGTPRSPALAVRIVADDASLDAAVAQVRGLLDRIRQGALREEDIARAARALAGNQLAASMDPRARAVALWRQDVPEETPTLESLRAFAAASLRDDALVVVAARPPHPDPRGSSSHDGRPRGR
jgi:hypothetical protein